MGTLPRLLPRTRTTGVCPRGAQVRPLGGLSPWPAPSSKQARHPGPPRCFYPGPHLLLPDLDRPIVALQRAAGRDLRGPAVQTQQLPHALHRVAHGGRAGRSTCGSGPASSVDPPPSRARAARATAPAPAAPTAPDPAAPPRAAPSSAAPARRPPAMPSATSPPAARRPAAHRRHRRSSRHAQTAPPRPTAFTPALVDPSGSTHHPAHTS